tara:strand:- start:4418 stop:5143 length:726 start_codon:yes stop_codon:yes gene_type:complete
MGYARGKYAQAISDRSGMAFPYNEMVKEWNGSFVHKSEFEAKHPQIRRKHIKADAIALANARPRTSDNTGDFVLYITNGLLTNPGMKPTDGQGILGTELTSYSAVMSLGNVNISTVDTITQTFVVTVVGGNPSNHPYYNVGSTNKFAIDGSTATADVTLTVEEGKTYRFDQSDSSNDNHPLRISATPNGTHAGGSEYTIGVTTNGVPGQSGAYTQITVAVGAPTLYYYCQNHSAMGWTINT